MSKFAKKKILISFVNILLFSFLSSISINAQQKVDVIIKFSEQKNSCRFVLETREDLVNTAKIVFTDRNISIDFIDLINPVYTKNIPFDVKIENKRLIINFNQKNEIKTFKLKEPPRIVIDIKKSEASQSKTFDNGEKNKTKDYKAEEKTIQSQKSSESKSFQLMSKVFVIDPGHGGYEFGLTIDSYIEKNITLTLAKDIERRLKGLGKKVYLVRRVDQYVPISGRIEFTYQKRPDIFLSIHLSSENNILIYVPRFEDTGSEDLVDFYTIYKRQKRYIERSKALAEALSRVFKETFKTGVEIKELQIPLLKSINAPSVMIEFPSPKYIVYDEKTRNEMVEAVLKGLAIYEQ